MSSSRDPKVHVAKFPDDEEVATVYRLASAMVGVGGVICLFQASDPHLTLAEARRARKLGGACLLAGVGGAVGKRSGSFVARLIRRQPPLTVVASLLPIAASLFLGGARTPAHFLGATGAAVSGGIVGSRRAPLHAAIGSALWIVQARAAARRMPGREQPDPMWVYLVYPLSLLVGAFVGAAMGEAALRTRSIQHTLRRFEAHIEDLEQLRKRLESAVVPFQDALAEWKDAAASQAEPWRAEMTGEAADRSLDRLADLIAALEAARAAGDTRRAPVDELMTRIARDADGAGLRVEVSGSSDGAVLSPRTQLAAHLHAVRGVNNARAHKRATQATIRLSRPEAGLLDIEVIDNGRPGTGPVRLGKGSRDSQAMLRSLGGDLELRRTSETFHALAHVPAHEPGGRRIRPPLADELVGLVEDAVWNGVRVDALMVLGMTWWTEQYVGRHRRRSQVVATAAVAAAEAIYRWGPGTRAQQLEAILAMTGVVVTCLPHREYQPLAGWGGMVLATYAISGRPARVVLFAGALASATIASFRGPHHQFKSMAAREGLGMVLGGLAALPVRLAFIRVERRERRLAGLVDELEQLQGIAEDVAYRTHGFDEPVANALGLFGDHPAAERLQAAIEDLRTAGAELSRALDDRRRLVDELADALAYRVWPAKVEVRDDLRPLAYPRIDGIVRQAASRRRLLDAMALAADHLLADVVPSILGEWPLDAVELTISDSNDDEVLVTLAPRPRHRVGSATLQDLTATLAPIGGSVRDGFDDGRLTFSIALGDGASID